MILIGKVIMLPIPYYTIYVTYYGVSYDVMFDEMLS